MSAFTNSITGKVLKAMSVFTGVQAVNILCAIVRTKFIALWIGPLGVGMFAIFNSILELLSGATQLNMGQSAVRDIAEAPQSRLSHTATVVRWWALRLGAVGLLITLLSSPVLSVVSFGSLTHWIAFAALSAAVLFLAVRNGELAILQGAGHLRMLARSTMWGILAGSVISIGLFYFLGISSIVPSIIVTAACGMISALLHRKTSGISLPRSEKICSGKSFLRLGGYITFASLVSQTASYAFISWLNRSGSTATVGFYQAGYTLIIQYAGIIFTALSMEFFPRITKVAHRRRMASLVVSHEMSVVLTVLTPFVVIFILAADIITRILYTSEFTVILPFITIGICGAVFRAISYCMSYVILARGDGKTFVCTELADTVVGLTLNIVLFSCYGYAGLGISYLLWYVIYVCIIWTVYRLRYGMHLSRRALLTALAAICCTIGTMILKML